MAIGPVPPIGPLNPDLHKRSPDEKETPKKNIVEKTLGAISGAIKKLFGKSGAYGPDGKVDDDDEPGKNVDTEA